jgi:acylphosphatase
LRIRGQVQGVSFRYYARVRANTLGLVGWIRNCPDGSVEAVVEGAGKAVDEFISWSRIGPSAARVESVNVSHEDVTETGERFEIRG